MNKLIKVLNWYALLVIGVSYGIQIGWLIQHIQNHTDGFNNLISLVIYLPIVVFLVIILRKKSV